MKKIIRGVILGLLAVIIIGGSAAAYMLFHGGKPEINDQPYIVDNEGNSYLAVENKDGVTYAAVTDAVGNIYAAEIKENGEIGQTIGLINDQVSKEDLPTNFTGERIDESVDVNAFTGAAAPVVPQKGGNSKSDDTTSVSEPSRQGQTQAQGGSSNTAPTQNNPTSQQGNVPGTSPSSQGNPGSNELKAYRVEKYQKIFESGQYLIEFKTSDPDLGDVPITAATKNGNVIITTTIESMSCKMLYLSKDKTTYLIIDDFKKYCKLPKDLMDDEDLDMGQLMSSFASEESSSKDIKVSKAKIGGQDLICESCTNDNGTETRYYFRGETLVRMDSVSSDGAVDSTYISRFTSDVPDSTFQIPKGYGYLNLSWLEGLAG